MKEEGKYEFDQFKTQEVVKTTQEQDLYDIQPDDQDQLEKISSLVDKYQTRLEKLENRFQNTSPRIENKSPRDQAKFNDLFTA